MSDEKPEAVIINLEERLRAARGPLAHGFVDVTPEDFYLQPLSKTHEVVSIDKITRVPFGVDRSRPDPPFGGTVTSLVMEAEPVTPESFSKAVGALRGLDNPLFGGMLGGLGFAQTYVLLPDWFSKVFSYDDDTNTLHIKQGVRVMGDGGLHLQGDGHVRLESRYNERDRSTKTPYSVWVNTDHDADGKPIVPREQYRAPRPLRGSKGRPRSHRCGGGCNHG